ncbi:hypothetical protein CLIB1423_27S00298 [[Candida] railenensis]|uniref:Fe2OG dioxygenase domain-containing protein n=1 Tax=[Candida] railenensis TaxID=45579 RepID=A0A9P0W1A1_9ASCO|nr:hypothetical protein CLIB1423_27S00298 [[Candida] railenensis]
MTKTDIVGLKGSRSFPIGQEDVEKVDLKYNVRHFKEAPLSKSAQDVDLIDLDTIDLSLFKDGPENLSARKELAAKVEKSLSTYGFIALENHGISIEEFDHLRSIAQSTCELPEEIQKKHLAGAMKSDLEDRSKSLGGERGAGFKPRKYWSMKNGVEDSIVLYNFREMQQPKFFDTDHNNYPELVLHHLPEIATYFRKLHNEVLRKLTILCDIVLELPKGFLWENYFKVVEDDYVNSGHGFGRFMFYDELNKEDEKKVDKNWLRGHSDSTGFTFITSQPILSLQIRDYFTGKWKYVGHKPGGLIVNIGDSMEFITGGYFKSSIHRVVSPPEDQRGYRRLVLIYFCNPKYPAVLDPEPLNSPKLQRLGIGKPGEWDKITFKEWDEEKGRLFGKKAVNDSPGDEPNLVLLYGRLHERWHQAESKFNLEEARKRFNIIEI